MGDGGSHRDISLYLCFLAEEEFLQICRVLASPFRLSFNVTFPIVGQLDFPSFVKILFWIACKQANNFQAWPFVSFWNGESQNKNFLVENKTVQMCQLHHPNPNLGKHVHISIITLPKLFGLSLLWPLRSSFYSVSIDVTRKRKFR